MSHDLVENGVTAAPAAVIRDQIGRRNVLPVEEAMGNSFHLRCLLDDRDYAGSYYGDGAVRHLLNRLHAIERELDFGTPAADGPVSLLSGRPLVDLHGDEIPLVSLPDEIASALDGDSRPPAHRGGIDGYLLERHLMGVLVFSFD